LVNLEVLGARRLVTVTMATLLKCIWRITGEG